MKYIPSIAFEEMSGSAKGVTAAKVRGRKYIRNRGYGGSTRTEFQSSVKGIFKQLSTSWKALSNAQILAWNKLAGTQAGHSVLGSSSKISGANLFMRLNYWIVYCGGEILQAPAAAADLRLVIQASAPQSNGITRAYSKAATIGGARACNTEEINLKVDYEEKNGTPSAAAPKSGELEADTVVKEILITAQSGARGTSDEKIRYYNLDAIISIGYRSLHHSLDAIISITAD